MTKVSRRSSAGKRHGKAATIAAFTALAEVINEMGDDVVRIQDAYNLIEVPRPSPWLNYYGKAVDAICEQYSELLQVVAHLIRLSGVPKAQLDFRADMARRAADFEKREYQGADELDADELDDGEDRP